MKSLNLFSKTAALFALCAISAHASAIVYNVNDDVGAFGHITGTVTTDGTIGVLSAGNFIQWNLNVVGNGNTDTLTDANSHVFIGGSSTTATAANIFFDFANPSPSYLLVQKIFGSANNYVCAASTPYPSTPCYQGASVVPDSVFNSTAQFSSPSGNQIIATAAGAVPEVASWAMMVLGFGGIGIVLRGRRKLKIAYC